MIPMIGPTRNGRKHIYDLEYPAQQEGWALHLENQCKLTVGFILPTFHPTGTSNPGISTISPIAGGFLTVGFPKPTRSPTRYLI